MKVYRVKTEDPKFANCDGFGWLGSLAVTDNRAPASISMKFGM